MPALSLRSEITDKAQSKWHTCMSKAHCKYPAIIAILLAIFLALLALYCALRCLSCCCCDCLSGGRYNTRRHKSSRKHRYADLAASPYTGYQQQQQSQAPGTRYIGEQPPQYARFERTRGGGGDDSLPKMPVWDKEGGEEGGERRVYSSPYDHDHDHQREERGVRGEKEWAAEREQRAPMLQPSQTATNGLDPAPRYEGESWGDLGYRPFGAGYVSYSAASHSSKGVRDV